MKTGLACGQSCLSMANKEKFENKYQMSDIYKSDSEDDGNNH